MSVGRCLENANKRSGAYSSGCYDSMPYILMNYHGNFNDVLTLPMKQGTVCMLSQPAESALCLCPISDLRCRSRLYFQ